MPGLSLKIKDGEPFRIGDAKVTLQRVSSNKTQVIIEAPRSTRISRSMEDPKGAKAAPRQESDNSNKGEQDVQCEVV